MDDRYRKLFESINLSTPELFKLNDAVNNMSNALKNLSKSYLLSYPDSMERLANAANSYSKMILETIDISKINSLTSLYNEQASILLKQLSASNYVSSYISSCIPSVTAMIDVLQTYEDTETEIEEEIIISEELTDDIYNLVDSVQSQFPDTEIESIKKEKFLTLDRAMTILGLIIAFLSFAFDIFSYLNEKPTEVNNYNINITINGENATEIERIFSELQTYVQSVDIQNELPESIELSE